MTENESNLSATSRHELRNIQLPVFFNTIRMQLQSANTFRFIDALRDRGLQFTAQEKGFVGYDREVHPGDVSVALLKLKRVVDDTSSEAEIENLCSGIALLIDGTLENSPIDLGVLWVNEDDYADACRQLGMETYWWPKVESPLESADLEERRCSDHTPVESIEHSAPQSVENIEAAPGKKPTVFDRRCKRLQEWLKSKNIPESEWQRLSEWSLRKVYDELKKYDEFLTEGLHIKFTTFKRHFWHKQKICKLLGQTKSR